MGAMAAHHAHFELRQRSERENLVSKVASLLAGDHARALPVLITLIWRKRVGGQPWLTALDWPGSPLASVSTPGSRYSARPATPSQAFQKSGVRDCQATPRTT